MKTTSFVRRSITALLITPYALLISLAPHLCNATPTSDLNAKDFGAVGDGITDDTDALNLAFAAVKTQKRNLFIPAGTYRCDKISPETSYRSLRFDAGGLTNIKIYGEGDASHLTTSAGTDSRACLLYIWAYSPCTNLKISNLKFTSNHPPATLFYHTAVFFQGTGAANFTNTLLTENTFSGFGSTIGGQGLNGWEISRNKFLSPRGHDDSQNSTAPAVHVWLYDNQNGKVLNARITDNWASGYTGTAPMSSLITHRPMDGFVFGHAYGITITGNLTENFCEEHYLLSGPTTDLTSTATGLIADNTINAALPPDCYAHNGTRKTSNYGIRNDASGITIYHNTITQATLGILTRTIDRPTVFARDLAIIDNTILMADDPANYTVSAGIYLIGGSANRLENITIARNTIVSSSNNQTNFNAVLLRYLNHTLVWDNTILHQGPTVPATRPAFAYGYVSTTQHTTNTVTGPLIPLTSLPGDQITITP